MIGLDYTEEMHLSKNLGEWSKMIGYDMGFSSARFTLWQDISSGSLQA